MRLWSILAIVYCLILTGAGCSDPAAGVSGAEQQAQQDSVTQMLAKIDSTVPEPAEKIARLQQFYMTLPQEQKVNYCQKIFRSIFNVAYTHPDSTVIPFYRQQEQASDKYPAIIIYARLTRAGYYLYINQQPDSGEYALKSLTPYLSAFNDTIYKSYYTLIAQAKYQKGDFQQAANYYLKTIKIAEKLKDSAAIMGNYGNLAGIYSSMDEEEKAVPIKIICLNYYKNQKNNAYAFIGDVSLARSYANLGNMDSAFYYYNDALKLKEGGVQNPSVEIILYTNLGEIYFERNDLKKSLHFFDLCKAPLAAIDSKEQQLMYVIYSAPAYESVQKDISKELAEMKEAITLFSSQNNLIYVKAAYYNMYIISQKRNQIKDALSYYKSYDSVSNIMASQANNKYITNLRTKYDLQKKETTIVRQQKEIERKTAYNRLLALLLIAGAAITALIITYTRLRRKRKEADIQQQFSSQLIARSETERSRLARDLHDGLGQNILVLKHQVKEGEKIDADNIDRLLEEVRAISRNVHPIMLDQVGFNESVNHICRQLSEKESLFISADLDYNGELGKERELQLFRIFQEGLNNVIKYAQAQAANIQARREGDDIIAVIRDNGRGFDVTATLSSTASFGLYSILERSRAINGKATINSGSNGTLIKIKIPIDV